MTMNLDALERAAVAGTMKWRDAHSLVSLARKLLRLRSAARDFYNSTVANPGLRLSASDKKTRDEAMRAGERLRALLEATAPGQNEHLESDRFFNIATEAWARVTDEPWSKEGLASAVEALISAATSVQPATNTAATTADPSENGNEVPA